MAPTVTNIAPATPGTISDSQILAFDITAAPDPLQRVFVFISFSGMNLEELVHDGTNFTEPYAALSSRTAIAGGYTYRIRRSPVWPDSPEVAVYAVDSAAAELDDSWPYVLLSSVAEPPNPSPIPAFPVGGLGDSADSGFVAYDQDHFLRLMPKVLDPEYVMGLQAGEGYEQLQAYASMFARVSLAIQRTAIGMLAAYARGGSLATGTVEFYRSYAAVAVTVKAGTIVQAIGGRYFRTLEDAVFGSSDLGPHAVLVRAVFVDWQHNTIGTTVTPSGVTIPGEVDTIKILVEEPALADTAIKVRQILDFSGGASPMLDLLARAQNISRQRGESDVSLSYRIRNLPDNLTPAAMRRNAQILLDPWRGKYEYVEPFDLSFQTAYDMPETDPNTNVFVYDDPRPRYFPAINWYADFVEQWGTFYINVGLLKTIRDYGGAYDDLAADAADLVVHPQNGRRAVPAYDLPDASTYGTQEDLGLCYDGRDAGIDGLVNSIANMMQSNRAAGIVAGLQQEGW